MPPSEIGPVVGLKKAVVFNIVCRFSKLLYPFLANGFVEKLNSAEKIFPNNGSGGAFLETDRELEALARLDFSFSF